MKFVLALLTAFCLQATAFASTPVASWNPHLEATLAKYASASYKPARKTDDCVYDSDCGYEEQCIGGSCEECSVACTSDEDCSIGTGTGSCEGSGCNSWCNPNN